MWVYIHARTVPRVWPRLKRPVRDYSRAVEQVLRGAIESRETFSILQVGAYDGISNDPLHELIGACPHVTGDLRRRAIGGLERAGCVVRQVSMRRDRRHPGRA